MKRIKATFIGTDANGYTENTEYQILVNQSEQGCAINIAAVRESFIGTTTYATINLFFEDWDRIRVL